MKFFRLSLKQFVLGGTLAFLPAAVVVGVLYGQLWAVSILIVFLQLVVMLLLAFGLAVGLWTISGAKRAVFGVRIPVRGEGLAMSAERAAPVEDPRMAVNDSSELDLLEERDVQPATLPSTDADK